MILHVEEAVPLCKLGEMVWLGRYFLQQWLFPIPLVGGIKKSRVIPYSMRGSHNVPADLRTVRSSSTLVWGASSVVLSVAKAISCASRIPVSCFSTRCLLFQGLGSPSIVIVFISSHLSWGRSSPSGSNRKSALAQLISSSEVLLPSSFS